MKKSYWLPLAISVSAILLNGTAFAQSFTKCKAFEFAEMQTMSKAELEQLYCTNKRTMESGRKMQSNNMDTALKMSGFALQGAQIGDRRGSKDSMDQSANYQKQAGEYGDNATACSAENDRVLRIIKKGNNKVEAPKCE